MAGTDTKGDTMGVYMCADDARAAHSSRTFKDERVDMYIEKTERGELQFRIETESGLQSAATSPSAAWAPLSNQSGPQMYGLEDPQVREQLLEMFNTWCAEQKAKNPRFVAPAIDKPHQHTVRKKTKHGSDAHAQQQQQERDRSPSTVGSRRSRRRSKGPSPTRGSTSSSTSNSGGGGGGGVGGKNTPRKRARVSSTDSMETEPYVEGLELMSPEEEQQKELDVNDMMYKVYSKSESMRSCKNTDDDNDNDNDNDNDQSLRRSSRRRAQQAQRQMSIDDEQAQELKQAPMPTELRFGKSSKERRHHQQQKQPKQDSMDTMDSMDNAQLATRGRKRSLESMQAVDDLFRKESAPRAALLTVDKLMAMMPKELPSVASASERQEWDDDDTSTTVGKKARKQSSNKLSRDESSNSLTGLFSPTLKMQLRFEMHSPLDLGMDLEVDAVDDSATDRYVLDEDDAALLKGQHSWEADVAASVDNDDLLNFFALAPLAKQGHSEDELKEKSANQAKGMAEMRYTPLFDLYGAGDFVNASRD